MARASRWRRFLDLFGDVDTVLAISDKLAWLRRVGVVVSAALAALLAATSGAPLYISILVGLAAFVLMLAGLRLLIGIYSALEARKLGAFPFAIGVKDMFSSSDDVQMRTQVLNRRADGRIALGVYLTRVGKDGVHRGAEQCELRSGLTLELGPEEISDGILVFKSYPGHTSGDEFYLKAVDVITGKETPKFRVPGSFPSNVHLDRVARTPSKYEVAGHPRDVRLSFGKVPPPPSRPDGNKQTLAGERKTVIVSVSSPSVHGASVPGNGDES